MLIREIFHKLSKEYPAARKEKLKDHPLAKFIRNEVPKAFLNSAGDILKNYKILVVKHAGNWSRNAWVVITDERVTSTATNGYYLVYSLFENGKKVMFSLGQGYRDAKEKYKNEAFKILISRGIILKSKSGNFKKYGFKDISKIKITSTKDPEREAWVKSSAFGKVYDCSNLPDENIFIQDLKNMLNIYDSIIQKGGVSEFSIDSIDIEDEDTEKLKGSEKKILKKHKEHEKFYIKTDPKLIKKLKEKFNYICQGCNIDFKKVYNNGNKTLPYAEAHHIVPKSEILKKIETNEDLGRDENDFAILCANCHKMIHRFGCPSLDEFKKMIKTQFKDFLLKL